MAKSFTRKYIECQFILAEGDFGGGNTLTVPGGANGLTMSVSITKPGLPDKNKANIKITGLSLAHMEQLTTLGFMPMESQKNLCQVRAGADDNIAVVFEGEITKAFPDMNGAPDIQMDIEAESGAYPQLIPEAPVSVQGEAPVADLIQTECANMGYTFKNEGVTASVRNAVFNGSPLEKIQFIAKQVGAEIILDDRTVILLPGDGTPREGDAVLLTPETGLLGYPTFTQDGIQCKCLFNPNLQIGGQVKIESIVPKATGHWKIVKLTHNISTKDEWNSDIEAQYVGAATGEDQEHS
jgi:hypothetical protein